MILHELTFYKQKYMDKINLLLGKQIVKEIVFRVGKVEKKQQKTGSRKGSRGARIGKKTDWLRIVRPQRRMLKELKEKEKLKPHVYRKVYKMIKGNAFRSKAHLMSYLKDKELLTSEKK